MHPKKTHHTEAEPETDSKVWDIKEHIWAMESGRTDIPSQSGHCPLFVRAHLQSKLLVYKTNCLVMQVSREASLLSPGAKFNKPLDSWSFCFKIWGHYFWPVNHQLSALPSKKKEMTAACSEASLYPSCCCMVQHSRREVGEALHSRALPAHR